MKHSVWREWTVIVLLLLLAIVAATRWEWFARVDDAGYDLAMRLWQRPAISDVVIVGVDDASLQQIGRWPWNRAVHATLIEKLALAKPAVIALDFILTEPDRANLLGDEVLGAVIGSAGRVILPVIPRVDEGTIVGDLAPVTVIGRGAMSLAQIHAQADADGVLRRVYLMGGGGQAKFRLMGYEALVASGKYANRVKTAVGIVATPPSTPDANGGAWRRDHEMLIPFAGPAGHFQQVSYVNVLRGDVPPQFFANKIVLVGVTASGLGDEFPTPVSGEARAMPGIEIHANVIQALAQGVELSVLSPVASAGLAALAVLVLMSAYLWLTPGRALLLAVAALLNIVLITLLMFRFGMQWISPATALFAMATTYPVWSWRKLAATQRYFDAELARLAAEPELLPAAATPVVTERVNANAKAKAKDFMEGQILAITAATERLRNLKRFVADTLESLPTAALVVDFKGEVLLANSMAESLLRGDVAHSGTPLLVGRQLVNMLSVLQPEEGGDWRGLLPSYAYGAYVADSVDVAGGLIADVGQVTSTPITIEAKTFSGGTERDCAVQFAPLYTHQGAASGMIVTIADVTPLKESERRRDEVLRFLSHDMRSPQASIITLLEMVRDDPDRIPLATLLDRIGKYSRRTLTLADDFLRMAKAERAKPSDFVPIELTGILQDVTDEAGDAARGKSIRVILNAPQDEAWVRGDRDLLTRAVINLLSNAIKYSLDFTTVTVALSQTDAPHRWRIDVTDEGFGIAPENTSRLFQRFQRIEQEGQPASDGIGLGLVFVKTVVERMSGEVQVSSQVMVNDGDPHGTTFSILLPAIDLDPDDV